MIEFKYRPDVDGLRAVAVILVLLFHAGLGFSGGFVGVDVFFVISGFLITGLIFKEHQSGQFRLSHFWGRRIRRILPAATFVVVTTVVAGWFLLLLEDLKLLAQSVIAQQLMLSNVFFWRDSGYFAGPSSLKPLLHTWSLAVEEQFYIGYPFLLIFLLRFRPKTVFLVLAWLTAASFALSELGSRYYPNTAFFLLPSRAWELLLGSLLCFVPVSDQEKRSFWFVECLCTAGFACICIAGCWFDSSTTFPGLAALLPCAGAMAIIYSGSICQTLVGRVLASLPFVSVGLMSYSLYLWHWPILVYARYWYGNEFTTSVSLVALLASFGCAYLSYRFVETPFRRASGQAANYSTILAAFAVTLIVVFTATGVFLTDVAKLRYSRNQLLAFEDQSWTGEKYIRQKPKDKTSDLHILGAVELDSNPNVLVWGDSHSAVYSEIIHNAAKSKGKKSLIGWRGGVPPIPGLRYQGQSNALNERLVAIALSENISDVIFIARWSYYVEGFSEFELAQDPTLDLTRHLVDDYSNIFSRDEAANAFRRCTENIVRKLSDSGKRVWIIKQVPEVRQNVAIDIAKSLLWHIPLKLVTTERTEHNQRQQRINELLDQLAADGAFVVDPCSRLFDNQEHVVTVQNGRAVYRDDDHLTRFGASEYLQQVFDEIFESME